MGDTSDQRDIARPCGEDLRSRVALLDHPCIVRLFVASADYVFCVQVALERPTLERRARMLAWATIGWNVVEAVVAIGAGVVAGSIALVGFGIDSSIEVFAAFVVLWRMRGVDEEREQRALRLIAVSFFVLGAYVVIEAVRDLLADRDADTSPVGIGLAVASLLVMPLLAVAKQRTGAALASRTVIADAAQTTLCAYLSVVLLAGLLLDATLGWWWADPVAALGIAFLAVREGLEAWEGEDCCS